MCAPLVTSQGDVLGRDPDRHVRPAEPLHAATTWKCWRASPARRPSPWKTPNCTRRPSAISGEAASWKWPTRCMRGFLPQTPPQIEGYEFFDFYEPANELGGDYFDYIELPGKRLAVVLADVSGKGIPASLLDGAAVGRRPLLPGERADAGRGGCRVEPRLYGRRLGRPLRDAAPGGARSAQARIDVCRRRASAGLSLSARQGDCRHRRRRHAAAFGRFSRRRVLAGHVSASHQATAWRCTPTASPRR